MSNVNIKAEQSMSSAIACILDDMHAEAQPSGLTI